MTKVLLIEDDEVDQKGFERLVIEKNLPYDYSITNSIAESKEVLDNQRFDIIIADYGLCDGTAFDILDYVNVPVIVITGNGDEEIAVNALRKGAYDYLIKDYDNNYMKMLPATVMRAVKQKFAEDQNRILLSAIMDTSDSIFVTDMDGKIIFINKAFTGLYGYAEEEIIRKDSGFLAFDLLAENEELIDFKFNENHEQISGEFFSKKKDSTRFPLTLSKSIVKNCDGQNIAIVGIVHDNTELKRIEKKKAQTEIEKRYRKLIETANDAIFVTEASTGIIIDVNNKAEELLGRPAVRIIGCHHLDFHPKDEKELYANIFKKNIINGQGINGVFEELFVCRKDGKQIPVEVSTSVVELGEKTVLQGIFRNITKRKVMEKKLHAIKEQLHAIINNSTALICLKDIEGKYLLINKKWADLFQKKMDEVFSKTDHEIFSKDIADVFTNNDRLVLETISQIEVEESFIQNNEVHTYLSVKFPLYDYNGNLASVCTISTDISRRKKIEKEILEIEERERERIGRDLHDSIGQTLTGIAFKSEILRHSLDEDNRKESVQAAEIETLINDSINQVRVLAKGLSLFDKDADNLLDAFNEFAFNINKIYKLSCVFNCDESINVKDHNTATHLYRIGQEAVNNAVKHAKAKNISIGLFIDDGQLVLTIRDDGIGIAEDKFKSKGMGLRTMRYRAGMINASFDIKKDPISGSIVTCTIKNK